MVSDAKVRLRVSLSVVFDYLGGTMAMFMEMCDMCGMCVVM